MDKLFIITGANGHVGRTILRLLKKTSYEVRGLILPTDDCQNSINIRYIKGDVLNKKSLRPLFENIQDRAVYVIHAAGIVDISEIVSPSVYNVNVNGTKNILSLCEEYKVKRLVYVSSVHALPVKDDYSVISETKNISPETVTGGYAKTKAEATQAVLKAAEQGLDAVVVHPSGIIGPYGGEDNYLIQMITDYLQGNIPACVKGGYDFVDVRDVASGCLLAAQKGKSGECYILSNRHYEIQDIFGMIRHIAGGRKLLILPMPLAKAAAPFLCRYTSYKKKRPLYTIYSLYTLQVNDRFSHDKATSELGYKPRDLYETIKDTVRWYKKNRQ